MRNAVIAHSFRIPGVLTLAAGGIIVLLAVLLTMNAAAIILRHRFQKHR